jgi:L-rhamnose mutarotase
MAGDRGRRCRCGRVVGGGRRDALTGMRRFGQRIRVRPEAIDEYERLHAEPWPGVLEQINRSNIRDYTIWRDGEDLFASFDYVGDDFAADMAAMAADPETQRWWTLTDAMQDPLPDREPGTWWKTMREVFHTD